MAAIDFTESVVEEAALEWLAAIGYAVLGGPEIAPNGITPERADYRDVVLADRLGEALERINLDASAAARADAFRTVLQLSSPSLVQANRDFHKHLVNGIEVEIMRDGQPVGELVRLIDFDEPANNDWLAVNQFTVEGNHERRPDVVLFINGLPLAVIELKNAADEDATIETAYRQLQTYQEQIPRLLHYSEILLISDGLKTELGCITTPRERFAAWKTVDGDVFDPMANLEVAIRGVFEHGRFLDLIRSFIVFEDDSKQVVKKVAQYHQFHAVRKALSAARQAASVRRDGKGGVLWHTQGSGKSLTMLFFAGKLIRDPAFANPTLVMLTDRTDLDDQLFNTFSAGHELLRQTPMQAESRPHLRELLRVSAGGVVFTTIQKFFPKPGEDDYPELSDRRNIIVMADEAHRSQYGFSDRVGQTGKFARGFAQHMRDALPNATFVAFTGTPLELADKDTRLVFGNYIDIYDVGRAIADGATVPIYYESRLIKLDLPADQADILDEEFAEITEEEEEASRTKLTSRWTQLEAVVGTKKRLAEVAADLVTHIERRQEALAGKVMIVCMSRRICVDLYDQLVALRPEWGGAGADDESAPLRIVMTGNATDPLPWQRHIRNKPGRERLAEQFKDPDDPFRIAIVRDMWLTGFDAPSLHTIYVDKPMRGHGLMQAISRVNRVWRDKPGGLVVDYIGLADNLKSAVRAYIHDGGADAKPIANEQLDIDVLIAQMLEKLDLCRAVFRGFNYDAFLTGSPSERLAVIPQAQQFLFLRDAMEGQNVKRRFLDHAAQLLKAFALASATSEGQRVKREVAFFQTVRASITKLGSRSGQTDEQLEHAIRQLVDEAIAPDGVVDIFAAAGIDKPDISVISDSFLAELKDMPQRNLALELLKKLLNDEIKARERTNKVQADRFSAKLEQSLQRYHNRAIETAQVIEALIELGREMREDRSRAEKLGISEDEVAFYDALAAHETALDVLGDEQLRIIAREVAAAVRRNVSIDWDQREQARAKLRLVVKKVLRSYGYPPDKQEAATRLVIEQAENFARYETTVTPMYRG